MASATPLFVKGKKSYVQSIWAQRIQEFEDQMRIPLKGKENVQEAPPRETESM